MCPHFRNASVTDPLRTLVECASTSQVSRQKPALFFLLAIGGTWLFWLIPVIANWPIWEVPAVWFLYAGGACVPLAAVTLAWRAGYLKLLAKRLLDPRLIPLQCWLAVLLFVPLVHVLAGGLAMAFGLQSTGFIPSAVTEMTAVQFLGFASFILFLGPLPEEVGWRGYALPALLGKHSPIIATFVLGFAWCVWHVPLFFLDGYYDRFGDPPIPLLFFGNILVISVFYTWLHMRTGGSVLAAVLFHFSVNFTGELVPIQDGGELIKSALLACIAFTIVACGRRCWMAVPSTY